MNNAFVDGLLPDFINIYTGTIIGNLDNNHVSFIGGFQQQTTLSGFSGLKPDFSGFNTMIQGVPDTVHQRIQQFLGNRFIKFSIFTFNNQLYLLVQGFG